MEPRTAAGTALLFAAAYAVWQPFAQLFLHTLIGEPLPFSTRAQWLAFDALCAAIGAGAGLVWFAGNRLPLGGWGRAWVRGFVRMIAMGIMLRARDLMEWGVMQWMIVVLLVAAFMGVLLMPLERWTDRNEARQRADAH